VRAVQHAIAPTTADAAGSVERLCTVVDVERGEHVHKHVVVKGQIEQGLLAKAAAGGGGHGRKEEREEERGDRLDAAPPGSASVPEAQKDGGCEQ
jgi:hypothetical protein